MQKAIPETSRNGTNTTWMNIQVSNWKRVSDESKSNVLSCSSTSTSTSTQSQIYIYRETRTGDIEKMYKIVCESLLVTSLEIYVEFVNWVGYFNCDCTFCLLFVYTCIHKAIVYACTYFESSSAVRVVQIHIYNIDSLCFHIKHKHSAWSIKNMTTQNFIHILFHCKWFCVRYPWHFGYVNKKDPFDIVNRTLLSILNSLNFLTFGL